LHPRASNAGVSAVIAVRFDRTPRGTQSTDDEFERIEGGGTEPTIPLLRGLAAALDADVRLTFGHDLGSVWFETPRCLNGISAGTAVPHAVDTRLWWGR
jgi:hypothetical protein